MAARARNARTKNYDDDDDESRRERDRLREERRKQTEREMRLENLKGKRKRDEDRDISERIALGQAAPTLTGEAMFDQRLFNQSSGISQGFGAEDNYNLFDKPLFRGSSSTQLFRPKQGAEDIYGSEADLEALKSTSRFKADKGFHGTESADKPKPRTNPVEFEKQPDTGGDDFDFLDDFMDEAKSAKMDDALSKSMMSNPRRPVEPAQPHRSPSPSNDDRSPHRRRSRSPRRNRSPRRSPVDRSPRRRRSGSPRRDYRRDSPDRHRERRRSRSPRRDRSPRRSRDYRRGPYDRPDDRNRSRYSPDRRSRR